MQRDGDGWVSCSLGHRHWGRHGAAGLLLHAVDDAGAVRVLMQHRAGWSHHGDTWGLPGGARDSHEDPVMAALREAREEAGLDPALIRARRVFVDDHGGWSYTTVYADIPAPVVPVPNRESRALQWVALPEVTALRLHPGFGATWPQVRAGPTVLLVDAANVVGSRPDGWWRDRPGAAARLLEALTGMRAATVDVEGRLSVIRAVEVVLEGGATGASDPGWLRVHRAPRGTSGDDVLVGVAAGLLADGHEVLAVSADRGLRSRWRELTVPSDLAPLHIAGPRWLLDLLQEDPQVSGSG